MLMPCEFDLRLKDGAMAKVRVTVEIAAPAEHRDARRADLESYLGGFLAGVSSRLVDGVVVSGRSSDLLPRE
jgi:hypothetical protein